MRYFVKGDKRDVCHCSVSSGLCSHARVADQPIPSPIPSDPSPTLAVARMGHRTRMGHPAKMGRRRALFLRLFMLPLFCIGLGDRIVAAQSTGVELRFDSLSLEPGESVNGQLICTNTGEPTLPPLPASEGYDLRLLNPTPATSQMMSITNGRATQRVTYTYSLRLTALKEGTFTIGPILVAAGGSTFPTAPITVLVRKTVAAQAPKGDRLLFVEIDAAPRSIYVTQEVQATLVFGIRQIEIDGRKYDLDVIRQVLDLEGSELSVFAGGQASRSELVLPDAKGVRHTYIVYRVAKTIRGEEAGPLRVGPVFLRAEYPTAVRADFFGRVQVARSTKETARVEGTVIDVKGPPLEGRPDSFTGSIGQFKFQVTSKPDRVEQGEPLTLAVAIEGAPLGGVAGPDLSRIPELSARFDFSKDEPVGDIEGNRKVFRRAIFPKQFGDQTIPTIAWSYFDPKSERYITLTNDPISIAVAPRTNATGAVSTLEETSASRPAAKLTVVAGGISPIVIDADAVLANHAVPSLTPFAVGALGAPPIAYAIAALVARHRQRLRCDPSFARRRGALRRAKIGLAAAWRRPDAAGQWSAVADILCVYLSDRFNLAGHALTPREVRTLLESNHVADGVSKEIVEFFETADGVRYAPSAASAASLERIRPAIDRWLEHLERHDP